MERLNYFNTSHGNILNYSETELKLELELEIELTHKQGRLELALDHE